MWSPEAGFSWRPKTKSKYLKTHSNYPPTRWRTWVRPEQRSAHNTSNKNHQTLESKDEPLRTPEHESKKRVTFLTLLVGHLNERYPMPDQIGHAIRPRPDADYL